ncbi:UNVERIFIED_CONTAM: hypothetical protein Sangu_0812100 [Sesamum angustifolium]|uniref:F-box domain-containing protein n=1 Tax=Sesamum angustifolium TaxID=2727405 RepID=A0AAW2PVW8_9LAMI
MADWSKLPYDIIHKVATYLMAVEDFLAFSAVCRSWRSVYVAKQWHQSPQVPWLMLSGIENDSFRSFISLYRNKVYNSELPEVDGRRCWGSSSGWLVTVGNDLDIRLHNPFTRVSVNLPPKSSLIFEILGCWLFVDLAISWRTVKDISHTGYIDVTHVKDQIFALCGLGYLVVIDIDSLAVTDINGPQAPEHVALSLPLWHWEHLILVESSGDLWMVYQNHTSIRRRSSVESIEFYVYF